MSSPVDLDAWGEILAAYRDVSVAIDEAFAGSSPAFGALSALVRRRLDGLRRRLPAGKEAVLVPLSFLLDEKVLAQLGTAERELAWPLLGRAFAQTDFGGDVFFVKADELCASAAPSPLVVQVYLFSLDEGFVGRYADDREGLADYRRQLFGKLAVVAPPGPPAPPPRLPVGPWPIWRFAAAAAGGVLAFLGVLWLVMTYADGHWLSG